MKKKLDVSGIVNELTGQSAFFRQAKEVANEPETEKGYEAKIKPPETGKDIRSHKSTPVQTHTRADEHGYRPIVRRTYDLFLDQVYAIEDAATEKGREEGKSVTKGEMMRTIVDFYFSKNK